MDSMTVYKAETASRLRLYVFKLGVCLCLFYPLCSFFSFAFIRIYSGSAQYGAEQIQGFMQSPLYMVYTLALSLFPLLLCSLLLLKLSGRQFSLLMFRPTSSKNEFFTYLLVGLAAPLAASGASALSSYILRLFNAPAETGVNVPSGVFAIIVFFIAHALISPLLEEFFFRSLMLEGLRPYGDGFAIIITAFMFSMLHSSFQSFLSAFVTGLIFGFIAVKTGSFLCPLIVHIVNNALSVSALLLQKSNGATAELIYLALTGALFITAVAVMLTHGERRTGFFSLYFDKTLSGSKKCAIVFSSISVIIFVIYSLGAAFSSLIQG